MVYLHLLLTLINTLSIGLRYCAEGNPDIEFAIMVCRIGLWVLSFAIGLAIYEKRKENSEDAETKRKREEEEKLLSKNEREKLRDERNIFRDFLKGYSEMIFLFFFRLFTFAYSWDREKEKDPNWKPPTDEELSELTNFPLVGFGIPFRKWEKEALFQIFLNIKNFFFKKDSDSEKK